MVNTIKSLKSNQGKKRINKYSTAEFAWLNNKTY